MLNRRIFLAVIGLLAAVSAGCGPSAPKLYPASGTVTFEGKPVEGASVLFIPQAGRPSMATTDASGKFTVTTNGKPGAPLGTYLVTVTKQSGGAAATPAASISPQQGGAEPSEEEKQRMMMKQREEMESQLATMRSGSKSQNVLPAKYANPEASGLSVTVTADETKNVFDLPLTP